MSVERLPIPGPNLRVIEIIWPDGAIKDEWLRVTTKADADTGLAQPDVFYFGNLVGDTGGVGTPVVNATDVLLTRSNVGRTTAAALNRFDFNRDGKIDAADVLIARNNQRHALPLFTAPAAPAGASPAAGFGGVGAAAPARPLARPPRRTLLAEPPPVRSWWSG